MSLINDALKKAQKQRTGEAPVLSSMPSVGGESPGRIARRAKPAGAETLVIRAGIGAGVLLVVVVGGYFAVRSDSQEKRTALVDQPSASVPPAALAGGPSASASPQVSVPAAAPAPTFTLPIAPKPEPVAQTPVVRPQVSAPAPAPATPAQPTGSDPRVSPFAPPSASNPQASSLKSQVSAAPPQPAAKLEPRAIQFIENIKVAGIRASATDSKVLMNDRVYRIGSVVEAEMGLKLVEIAAGALTFEDERGARYTRTF